MKSLTVHLSVGIRVCWGLYDFRLRGHKDKVIYYCINAYAWPTLTLTPVDAAIYCLVTRKLILHLA